MHTTQSINEAIDIANWFRDEEFAVYPEGARVKTLLYCPDLPPYPFLHPGQRYLFKRSSPRYSEQFWVEIFAYQLSKQIHIPVPPAYVAYNSSEQDQAGALIEWFLQPIDKTNREIYTHGGDYCQQHIPSFDRKKGKQHSFEIIEKIFNDLAEKHSHCKDDWKIHWAKILTFDSIIGNTDRHQDNWGIILNPLNGNMRIAPIFDNGTSMGHELSREKLAHYSNQELLEKYISRGWHHMKWGINDPTQMGHAELLEKLVNKYPETYDTVLMCLKKINIENVKNIFDNLISFNIPSRLSIERANFMLQLLRHRVERLLHKLEK